MKVPLRFTLLLIVSFSCATSSLAQLSNQSSALSTSPIPQSRADLSPTFTSIAGGFTIALPEKPSEQTSQSANAATGSLETHRFSWFTPKADYVVMYMETAKQLEDPKISKIVLDNARDTGLKKENGKLLSERDLNLDGHVGREVKIQAADGIFIDRVYLVKQRWYLTTVFIPTANLTEEAAVSKILDSFKLITDPVGK